MPVIYSSASADNVFPRWVDHPRVGKFDSAVTVKGGAGVQGRKNFITPRGVSTVVSAEDLEFLKTQPLFMLGVKKGFYFIDEKARKSDDPDEVAGSELEVKDKGAQDTEADLKKAGKKTPVKKAD